MGVSSRSLRCWLGALLSKVEGPEIFVTQAVIWLRYFAVPFQNLIGQTRDLKIETRSNQDVQFSQTEG